MTATVPPGVWPRPLERLRAAATAHPLDLAWLCPCGTTVPRGGVAWQLADGRWCCDGCTSPPEEGTG